MICATFSGVSGVSFLLATCNSSNAQTLNKRANNPIAVPFNEYSHNHSHWCHWVKVITICNFCQPSFPQNKIILHGACSALDTSLFFAFQSHLYSLYSKTQNSPTSASYLGFFFASVTPAIAPRIAPEVVWNSHTPCRCRSSRWVVAPHWHRWPRRWGSPVGRCGRRSRRRWICRWSPSSELLWHDPRSPDIAKFFTTDRVIPVIQHINIISKHIKTSSSKMRLV